MDPFYNDRMLTFRYVLIFVFILALVGVAIAWPFIDLRKAQQAAQTVTEQAAQARKVISPERLALIPATLAKFRPTIDHTFSYGGFTLTVSDQSAGRIVNIGPVRVRVPVWVVIYDDLDGFVGPPLGRAYFPSAEKEDQIGGGSLDEPLVAGRTYFAALHGDTDGRFDPGSDPVMKNASGTYFIVRFRAF